MLAAISSLASPFVKIDKHKVKTVGFIFWLHYPVTVLVCFVFCFLVTTNDLFGSPIVCEDANPHMDQYCWVTATFTINSTFPRNFHHQTFYHAYNSDFKGIGEYDGERHVIRVHLYYQWVPIILFIQGSLFCIPYRLWKVKEGSTASILLQDMRVFSMDADHHKQFGKISRYFGEFKGKNNKYAYGYFLFDTFNLLIVILQMFVLNGFLGGVFLDYGFDVIKYALSHDSVRHDPLIYNFPRIATCAYHKYGGAGAVNTQNVLCLLPQNIVNEKIFIFLWFWFVLLSVLGFAKMAVNTMMVVSGWFRFWKVHSKIDLGLEGESDLRFVENMPLGDLCLLLTLGRNLHPVVFKDLIFTLKKELPYARNKEDCLDQQERASLLNVKADSAKKKVFYPLLPCV